MVEESKTIPKMEEDFFVSLVALDESKVLLHDRDDSYLTRVRAPVEDIDIDCHAGTIFLDLSHIEFNLFNNNNKYCSLESLVYTSDTILKLTKQSTTETKAYCCCYVRVPSD